MPKFRSKETMRAVKYEPGMETGFQNICDDLGQCVTAMRDNGTEINCCDCNKENLHRVPYVLNCDMPPHRMCIPEGGYLVVLEDCTDDSKCYTDVLTKEELEENWEEVEE